MTKENKLPAFQFYPGDWRKDPGVQSLNYFDRGVWLEMLCLMHESSERGVLLLNGRAMPEEALARLLGLDNQILTTTLSTLLTYGVAHRRQTDGAIFNKRMVRDEEIREIRRIAGLQGGNPNLLKQKRTTQVKQKTTPSSSSSSSNNRDLLTEDLSGTAPPDKPPLVKFGPKLLSMTEAEMAKIRAKYGNALVDQELPMADEWIERSDTPNGRKYRKPGYNHYLFFSNTWLRDKRLKGKACTNGTARGQMTGVDRYEENKRVMDAFFGEDNVTIESESETTKRLIDTGKLGLP